MKRLLGFVRWFDLKGDDGILTDFEGNKYYFNSWSFPNSKWGAKGICKKTGKKKFIKTRFYPGLFLIAGSFPDKTCKKVTYDTPVEFEQAEGISQRWAVKIKLRPDLVKHVLSSKLLWCLESMDQSEFDFKTNWFEHYEKNLERLIEKVEKTK